MAETFKCAYCGKEFPFKNGYYNYPGTPLCIQCNDKILKGQKNLSINERVNFVQKALIEKIFYPKRSIK